MLNEVKHPHGIPRLKVFSDKELPVVNWLGFLISFGMTAEVLCLFVTLTLPLPNLALWATNANNEYAADSPGHRIPD